MDIYVAAADGSGAKRLTTTQARDTAPCFSPTGAEIAFTSDRTGTPQLWLMDSDGSNPHQIYPPVGENSAFSRDENFMAWAPDGRSIAFIFDNDLFLLDVDSGTATRVTQDDTVDSHPVWSIAPTVQATPTPRTTPTPPVTATATPNGNGRITTTPTSGNEE